MNTKTHFFMMTAAAVTLLASSALAESSATRTHKNGGVTSINRSTTDHVTTTEKSYTSPDGKTANNTHSADRNGRFVKTTDTFTGTDGETHSRSGAHRRGRRF